MKNKNSRFSKKKKRKKEFALLKIKRKVYVTISFLINFLFLEIRTIYI